MRSLVIAVTALLMTAGMASARDARTGSMSCEVDGAIEATVRTAVEAAAVGATEDFIANRRDGLDSRWASEARALNPTEQIWPYRIVLAGLGELHNLGSRGTYLVTRNGDDAEATACGPTISDPQGIVAQVARYPREAIVQVEVDGVNNTAVFTYEMVEQEGAWRILSFHLGNSRLAQLDAAALGDQARVQRARGHRFNATMLVQIAAQLLDRGPNITSNVFVALKRDFEDFQNLPDIMGAMPLQWMLEDHPESIRQISLIGLEGKVWLLLQRASYGEWSTDASIDAENRRFIEAFLRRYPEISDAFGGIVVQAAHPDGHRIYGTVWSAADGFGDHRPST